ncbi:Decapping nuclease-like protein [Hapsidospora chrysogenum ATCC 11550]|uniref:Decapping nuclease n=1 Tax=Hapsidospora chrysogenum (strain ATCC 11550 / CBS 779.69 / DSM 880 / IAM 14645 / JCM 23072 / IMI 49137) TaxID=857340 RepID=A0A086TDY0_HAPC1|nr:Decapping nuclease-like protein [Hapsidospora chrysogenum ATCC 11550]
MSGGNFSIQPIGRFAGASQPVKRPKEIACFSYDENHQFHLDDSSLKYYYTPQLGADLSKGFESFQKQDDSTDEHLHSLLRAIIALEEEQGKRIDANVVTWRGMMTKIMAAPFEKLDGFIEENHAYKMASRSQESRPSKPRRGPPLEVMQYWGNLLLSLSLPPCTVMLSHLTQPYPGYKFETLATLPAPWAETSRDFIEDRENHIVNNKEQYCSVVRTGIGKTILCLGGEVDAIWDAKPQEKGRPINWVELKTSAEIRNPGDMDNFHRKLMKYWIQSFLLGVPRIIVGFRTRDGILVDVSEVDTQGIPQTVNSRPNPAWNADMCVNFAGEFLEWLMATINDEGVWRIRRRPQDPNIEVFKVEETGHGEIISDEFKNWRIKLALRDQEGT